MAIYKGTTKVAGVEIVNNIDDDTSSSSTTYSSSKIDTQNTYSTDEVDTGKKWIDGKTIYRKVIDLSLASQEWSVDWHDLKTDTISNLSTVVNGYLIAGGTSGVFTNGIVTHSGSKVRWYCAFSITFPIKYAVIEYTKSS